MAVTTTATEPDPRIERTRRVVLDSAAEIISECGFGRASIKAISKRSGVARSTIYRHWPKRVELLIEAVGRRIGPVPSSDTGDLRTDAVNLLNHLAGLLTDDATATLVASFLVDARRDSEFAALHNDYKEGGKAEMMSALNAAIERGELKEIPQAMRDDLVAPLFYRSIVNRLPIDSNWVEAHVDRWIRLQASV
jgi:AcrR family transcriptional regulator